MKKTLFVLALTLVFGAVVSQAAVIQLTFEGIGDLNPVGNWYNGGGGPNYGITFNPDALAVVSAANGGSGNFDGQPAPGDTILFFLTGSQAVMTYSAGFTTGFSFYYSAPNTPGGFIDVWDGPDGTGNPLAHLDLGLTPSGGPGCSGNYTYCPWVPVGVGFAGTAQSVSFGGVANYIGFDNVTFGSTNPTVPEPGTLALFGSGVLGLAGLIRRKLNL